MPPESVADRLLRRLPLSKETVEAITARLIAGAVDGVEPTSPAYPDLVLGTVLHDVYGAVSLELDRAYDKAHREIPAKALPTTTDGLWLDNWAEALGLERKDATFATGVVRFTSPGGSPETPLPAGLEITTEQVAEDQDEIAFVTTEAGVLEADGGTADIAVRALTEGSLGNVASNTVTIMSAPIASVTVTNPAAITGGSDIETDEELSRRVALRLAAPSAPGNIADYEEWVLAWPGVGFVTVQPAWNGPTTVRTVITDPDNNPSSGAVIAGLQAYLDPVAGEGRGKAPVGHVVTVATPADLAVAVDAALTFEAGNSLDGAGGTRALRSEIEAALAAYINSLPVGADVIRYKVIAAIVDVKGVANLTALTLNGAGGDVAVAALEVASLTTPPTLA